MTSVDISSVSLRSINTVASASKVVHVLTVAGCGYEAVALSRGWPGISRLCWKHPRLTPLVVGVLGVHLILRPHPLAAEILRSSPLEADI